MLKVGNNEVTDVKLGNTQVNQVYLGSNLIWEKSSPLPYDAEIAYLQGDGASYIDTGYYANSNSSFEMVLKAESPTQAMGIFSIKSGCQFSLYQLNKSGAYTFRFQVGYSSNPNAAYYSYQSRNSFNNNYTFALKKNEFYLNNVIRNTFAADTFTSSETIPMFAARLSTGIDSRMFNGRIYWCKVWDGDTLVRDFIPVRVGQVGYMYDRVAGQLYGNQGTGSFILGADKN